jgi:hypothetical protein
MIPSSSPSESDGSVGKKSIASIDVAIARQIFSIKWLVVVGDCLFVASLSCFSVVQGFNHELVVEKSHFSDSTTELHRTQDAEAAPTGLNTLPPMFPSLQGRFQSKTMNVVSLLLCTVGLYYFAHSFFLAKRNLPNRATCDEAPDLLQQYLGFTQIETDLLQRYGLLLSNSTTSRNGCWMSRRIDSLVIIIIDALRFDFALYNLPQSVGKRIAAAAEAGTTRQQYSRLVQFVADPPTVTMQRIKGLTTGGVGVLWMIL